jgi:predicted site-specific integrase-resolvase
LLFVNLSGWAQQEGVSKYTACRWYHAGTLPVPARRAGRLILVEPAAVSAPGRTVVCARVSSAGQRPGLGRLVARLTSWVTGSGRGVGEVVAEIGSAMNGRRRRLGRILAGPAASLVVAGRRGRLARFGAGHLQAALAAGGREVVIVGSGEIGDDLVRDVTGVLASLCACLCGRRGARNRALRALGCAQAQ